MLATALPPVRPRRRHRLVTAPAGLLLFICFFLPAVRGCGSPVYPIEVPIFSLPYLLGACAVAAALTSRGRAERIFAGVVMVLSVLSTIWFALWLSDGDALVGVYLAFVASVWLVVGSGWWRRELKHERPEPVGVLPVARLAHVHLPSSRHVALVVAMLASMGVSFALAPPTIGDASSELDLGPVFWGGC
jgi:hypothetical protein